MPAEARISSIWRKQKLFISLFFIAFGAWFFWDGLVRWPRSNERWHAFEQAEKEGRLEQWRAEERQAGRVTTKPHKYYKRQDLLGQYFFGAVTTAVGTLMLLYWVTQKNRILRSDTEAVYSAGGTRVPFGAITGVGKKKWETKGIARVRYELDGRRGEFVVDDYKFETEPARQILQEIESHLLARTGGGNGEGSAPPSEK
jgi:hypothetical protein